MKKGNLKGFLLGVVVTLVLSGVLTAFAATIDVEIGGIRIFWNGEEKTLTDVNGNKVEPMIYNGTTYVPVRAMSELMGKTVEWDEATTSVYVGGKPAGNAIATVNGNEITNLDVNYYVYVAASEYAQQNGLAFEDLTNYDWNQIIDGAKLSDTIKEKALNDAIDEALLIQTGAENGITLSDTEKSQIDAEITGITSSYGEDGFTLRARTMGISSPLQYKKMYTNVMALQKVESDIEQNPEKYLPEDINVLNNYITSDGATVKHILIQADDTNRQEKRKETENLLRRIQNGEDFDTLMNEYGEDPGQTAEGYTFGPGEMVEPFEKASFALKIGEVSGIVESDYGFHIIKRLPGKFELSGYLKATRSHEIVVIDNAFALVDVNAVMADVLAASEELSAQQY